jgi:pimeloyl-ACP methyl ester carboxylesterase
VVVPGLGTDAGSASAQADRALTLRESTRFLHRGSVATLAWIGYDAPDNVAGDHDALGVVREGLATRGGERLADALDGLRASRTDDPAHLTVIGNSYGSTTTAHGATDHGLPVDDIVLTGSPGAGDGAEHAADLGVGTGHVWVASGSHDPVAGLADEGWVGGGTLAGAGLGDDPAEDDFGARRMQAESVTRGEGPGPFADHTAYFDHDSESLANISHVVAGEYADVRLAGHRHDPWYAPPWDPEGDRLPTTVTTRRP